MLADGVAAASFINVLGPTLQSKGFPKVGITCCDAVGWGTTLKMIPLIQQAGAEKYLSRVTSHAYSGVPNSRLNTTLRIWQTEYAQLSKPWTTNWHSDGSQGDGMTWADTIHGTIVNANLSGFLYWWGEFCIRVLWSSPTTRAAREPFHEWVFSY